MGLNVVPIWVNPTGCLVRLLKRFCWDLYESRDEAAQKGTAWVYQLLYGTHIGKPNKVYV